MQGAHWRAENNGNTQAVTSEKKHAQHLKIQPKTGPSPPVMTVHNCIGTQYTAVLITFPLILQTVNDRISNE